MIEEVVTLCLHWDQELFLLLLLLRWPLGPKVSQQEFLRQSGLGRVGQDQLEVLLGLEDFPVWVKPSCFGFGFVSKIRFETY